MSEQIVDWWPASHDKLRRALLAQLTARGHPSPAVAAALIAVRYRLQLRQADAAAALDVAPEVLQRIEGG